MPVSAYIGLPGSGKSYSIVKSAIIPASKNGREVWTNIPLNDAEFEKEGWTKPKPFSIEDINENANWFQEVLPKGVLIIIDECQMLWPAGLKQNTANAQHLSFLTQHRHMVGEAGKSTEIIICTQRLALTSIFIRGLIEKTFVTNNLGIVGQPKKYRIDIYPGAITSDKPNTKHRISEEMGSYNSKIYRFYKSHTQGEMAGDETRIDDRLNIFRSQRFYIFCGVLGVVVLVLGLMINSFLTDNMFIQGKAANDVAAPVQAVKPVEPGPGRLKTPSVVKKALAEKTIFDDYDFYVSLNMGVYPRIVYEFVGVSGNGSQVKTNPKILRRMGYKVLAHDSCLVEISKGESLYFLGCMPAKAQDGVLSSVTNAIL